MIGFVIWAVVGCFFIGMGIYSFSAKKATGFWANAQTFQVNDVKKYNCAMGKLWIVFGTVFILLGLPLLTGPDSPFIFVSVFGIVIETLTAMTIYTQVIERKYRKR